MRNTSITHAEIIADIAKLGLKNVDEGFCYGYHAMVVNAILCGQLKEFIVRLKECSDKAEYQIFLQGISIFQNYRDYFPLLFSSRPKRSQDLIASSKLLMPLALEKNGGLHCALYQSGIYDFSELIVYFSLLKDHLCDVDRALYPFAIAIGSFDHVVTLTTVKTVDETSGKKSWLILNSWDIPDCIKTDALAGEISIIFHDRQGAGEFAALEMYFYCRGCDRDFFEKMITRINADKEWTALHAVTSEKAKRKEEKEKINWLYFAAKNGDIDLARSLIDAGSDLNDDQFNSTIKIAALQKNTDMVHLLLSRGSCDKKMLRSAIIADDLAALEFGFHAMFANECERVAFIKARNDAYQDEHALIHVAAFYGSENCLGFLIQKGADIELESDGGSTPLILAAQNGHLNTVRLLLSLDATKKIDHRNNLGFSALHYAAFRGYEKIVTILLANNASHHILGKGGETAVYYASQNANLRILKVLLEFGADINMGKNGVIPPLTIATTFDLQFIMEFLIQNGSTFICSEVGCSPLEIARSENLKGAEAILVREGAGLCHGDNAGDNKVSVYCENEPEKIKVLDFEALKQYLKNNPEITKKYFLHFKERQHELKTGVFQCIVESFSAVSGYQHSLFAAELQNQEPEASLVIARCAV